MTNYVIWCKQGKWVSCLIYRGKTSMNDWYIWSCWNIYFYLKITVRNIDAYLVFRDKVENLFSPNLVVRDEIEKLKISSCARARKNGSNSQENFRDRDILQGSGKNNWRLGWIWSGICKSPTLHFAQEFLMLGRIKPHSFLRFLEYMHGVGWVGLGWGGI